MIASITKPSNKTNAGELQAKQVSTPSLPNGTIDRPHCVNYEDPPPLHSLHRYRKSFRQDTEPLIAAVLEPYLKRAVDGSGRILELGAGDGYLKRALDLHTTYRPSFLQTDPIPQNNPHSFPDSTKIVSLKYPRTTIAPASCNTIVTLACLDTLFQQDLNELFEMAKYILQPGGHLVCLSDLPPSLAPLIDAAFNEGMLAFPFLKEQSSNQADLYGLFSVAQESFNQIRWLLSAQHRYHSMQYLNWLRGYDHDPCQTFLRINQGGDFSLFNELHQACLHKGISIHTTESALELSWNNIICSASRHGLWTDTASGNVLTSPNNYRHALYYTIFKNH